MKLTQVIIENFRSIKDAKLDFKTPFKILVGKNESGKSNILKALSLLDPENLPTKEDLREGVNNFDKDVSAEITFEFELNKADVNEVYEQIKSLFLVAEKDIDQINIALIDETPYTVYELCQKYNKGLFIADVIKLENRYTYWLLKDNWSINIKLKRVNENSDPIYATIKQKYKDYKIVDASILSEEEMAAFTDCSAEQIHDLIGDKICEFMARNHPQVINWKYDERNLLPDSINIDTFIADPNSFTPLKTMFELADIHDIKEAITTYKDANNYHKFNNFLEKIAEKTSKHFREVWKEYKNIEFTLNLNGSTIVTGIKETNTYSFKQRSDGFKRFVTFLLMVSATYKTENLKNAILLIDEPDVSLHPSGIRYLRDELIKISKHNIICASTHSIFLIDNSNLNRHYIIKKENEITTIEEVNEENLINEEVVYNALGFSFYETLRKENLVFEGWRDKELFRKALEKGGTETKELKEYFKGFGLCHINGVKEAKGIAPLLELSARNFVIISDNDKTAIERKKDFIKEKTHGKWLTYKDCYNECEAITGEDFLKKEYLVTVINSLSKEKSEFVGNPNLGNATQGTVAELDRWLNKDCGIADPQVRKKTIDEIKERLFDSLKAANIDNAYYVFLTALKEKLETM